MTRNRQDERYLNGEPGFSEAHKELFRERKRYKRRVGGGWRGRMEREEEGAAGGTARSLKHGFVARKPAPDDVEAFLDEPGQDGRRVEPTAVGKHDLWSFACRSSDLGLLRVRLRHFALCCCGEWRRSCTKMQRSPPVAGVCV